MNHKKNSFVFLSLLLCLLFSCKEPNSPVNQAVPNFSIISPQKNWTFYADEPIYFTTDLKNDAVEWFSSVDGAIGIGNGFYKLLNAGEHVITARLSQLEQTKRITVVARNLTLYQSVSFLINSSERKFFLPNGTYLPVITTYKGSVENISVEQRKQKKIYSQQTFKEGFGQLPLLRDITFKKINKNLNIVENRNNFRSMSNSPHSINNKKRFSVINTRNQLMEPHQLDAECIASEEYFTLWKPVNTPIDTDIQQKLVTTLNTLIFPRLKTVWGDWADINNDGKITIVLTDTLNNEKLAVGYFNPQDLFKKNTDSNSPSYNPYSNEMDVVFLGIPQSVANSSFSVSAILATAAHEITHAITFNQKTYSKIINNETFVQTDVFLDEGWGHISENICGLGISGGNIVFLQTFLQNTGRYSFCSANIFGQQDSAGRRGAMILFLSYLFWKKGGIVWDSEGKIIDNGGIRFLRAMINSPYTGWNCIGKAYGAETKVLFQELVTDLNRQRSSTTAFKYRIDPITKEPVEFFIKMGVLANSKVLHIDNPNIESVSKKHSQPEWSFQFLEPVQVNKIEPFVAFSSRFIDEVFLSFMYVTK